MRRINYDFDTCVIGLVSDTHIPTRKPFLLPELFHVVKGVDLIFHARDLVEGRVLTELETIAPVEAVAGNMDHPGLKNKLGLEKIIVIGGTALALTHGTGPHSTVADRVYRHFGSMEVQGIIFGHSHEPFLERRDGILLVNPGSVSDPRRGSLASCARLHLDGKRLEVEFITLQ